MNLSNLKLSHYRIGAGNIWDCQLHSNDEQWNAKVILMETETSGN